MALKVKWQIFHMNGKVRIKYNIRKEEKEWRKITFCVQIKNYIHVIDIYISYTISSFK